METGLLHLHSILRWVILLGLLVSIYSAYTATATTKKTFWLVTLIASHITLLIGLYQVYGYYQKYVDRKAEDASLNLMKDKHFRFYIIEHPLMMIISIVLITLAYRNTKVMKYKKAATLFAIALVIILASIPWPFRDVAIARGWMAGMK
jgi:hypothetical membrane protein